MRLISLWVDDDDLETWTAGDIDEPNGERSGELAIAVHTGRGDDRVWERASGFGHYADLGTSMIRAT